MTDRATPLLDLTDVVKRFDGPAPFRLLRLVVSAGDRIALGGLHAGAAETFVHLVTGAALPEQGEVIVAGTNTREIATDTAWLASLDRFGIVTERAVMIDKLPVAANLALPLTLAIEPIPPPILRQVETLAAEAGLDRRRLTEPVASLTPGERVRLHLARALASNPELLLLEDPTKAIDAAESAALGRAIQRASDSRGFAVVALTSDDGFARACGATRYRVIPATGALARRHAWQRI